MRCWITIAALLAAGSAAAQQAPALRLEAVPRASGGCTVVPILPDAPIPVVEVTIGGKGPYRFAIDTGAQGHGRISAATAQALGLATVGEIGTPAPGGTVATRPVFGVPELTAGGVRFQDLQLVALSNVRGAAAAWDGILGIGLFQQVPLTLDYGNARARIGGPGLAAGLPLTFDHAIPVVPLDIGGKRFAVHLDTGNGASALFLDEAAARALPLAGAPVERGRARTSFGEFAIMEAPLAVPVKAGDAVLPVKAVGWPSARPGGNLGSKALAGMTVTVDTAAKRAAFAPSAAPPACPA